MSTAEGYAVAVAAVVMARASSYGESKEREERKGKKREENGMANKREAWAKGSLAGKE